MTLLARIASDMQLMWRRPPRQQYAALCHRWNAGRLEVLLVTSRDTGRWVIPKGWPMEGRTSPAVAEREAYEEAGVRGTAEKLPLGYYSYQKGLDHGMTVTCRVQVHALAVDAMCAQFPEHGSRLAAWVSCAEAAERVNEPELKALMGSFAARMAERRVLLPAQEA